MSVLDRIVDDTRDEVKRRRKAVPLKDLEKALERRAEGFRPFSEALTRPGDLADRRAQAALAVGGEDPQGLEGRRGREGLRAGRRGGALDPDRTVSLRRFARRPAARRARARPCRSCARTSSSTSTSSTKRAAAGADAILLIVAALEDKELRQAAARGDRSRPGRPGRGPRRARARRGRWSSRPTCSGSTTAISPTSAWTSSAPTSCCADVPAGKTVVSESGFSTREQLDELERVGVDAVLIGETLMRADDIEQAVA